MATKQRKDLEAYLQTQKEQLGLGDDEVRRMVQESEGSMEFDESAAAASPAPVPGQPAVSRKSRENPADPYLPQSQTIKVRPVGVSQVRSLFFEHALPNEFIMPVGVKDAVPVLGGRFFRPGKKFIKFPAAVQTVYFTSDNANKNYQGLKIDGYACWRIDPERPEIAARTLDFSDRDNPMGNTNRILRTICTEAIRHIIANVTIEDALTKKDEIGRDLKSQLERIERTWGVLFDQVGIERVTILSSRVFDDLQQKTRDALRLAAAESRMQTDRDIEKKRAEHNQEMERLRSRAEKEARILKASTESEVHKIELDERAKREAEERRDKDSRLEADALAAEREAARKAETAKNEESRRIEVQSHQIAEARRLELVQASAEAETRIKTAEFEAREAQAVLENRLAKARADRQGRLTELELEIEEATRRQKAELERETEQGRYELESRLETARAEHEMELARIERFKAEEEIRNLVSDRRLTAEFMARLPQVAAALKVDRYTVLDGSGGTPLVHFMKQAMALVDEVRRSDPAKDPAK